MKQLYPQLNKVLQFRLNKIKEIEQLSNAEINERLIISKILKKYIASPDHV